MIHCSTIIGVYISTWRKKQWELSLFLSVSSIPDLDAHNHVEQLMIIPALLGMFAKQKQKQKDLKLLHYLK